MKECKRYLGFIEWMYSHSGDDTVIGDLCASALADPLVHLEMSQKDYVVHLHSLVSQGKADRTVLKTVEDAILQYRVYHNKVEQAILLQTERTWLGNGSLDFNRKQTY